MAVWFEQSFSAIYTVGSAREYVALFEKLAGQLVGVPEIILEGTFIKGLKQDLRVVVRVLNPEGLSYAMKLAVSIEENKLFRSASQGRDLTQDDTKTPSPKHQLLSPSAPNAPSKTPSTKDTSSSSIDYIPKSPPASTSPSPNSYLNSPTSPPPRTSPPPLT
ncbi:hypothetical protein Tco_0946230 [Tanacetum coccineum]